MYIVMGYIMKDNRILQLQTFPAAAVGFGQSGLQQFRKELIKVGRYVKDSHAFNVTLDTLNYWVKTFDRWIANGNKVPIPPGHDKANDPTENQGWVTSMFVENNSLFGIMELKDPALAKVTDVSISVPLSITDGNGEKYVNLIDHVALCVDPVITGLEDFTILSLSIGEQKMEFLKKLAAKLSLTGEPTEEGILAKLGDVVKPDDKASETTENVPALVKLLSENRAIKLSALVKAGKITPAMKEVIEKKYVDAESIKLELSSTKDMEAFDLLFEILSQNKPVDLSEQSGVQALELANVSTSKPNPIQADVTRRRAAAGMDKS